VGDDVRIVTSPTDDRRSYHVSSEKIRCELGWQPRRTVTDAIRDLIVAFRAAQVPNSLADPRYFNIKTMNAHLAAQKQAA
jgi:dTDP-D-glucose 4,6-dehydratase